MIDDDNAPWPTSHWLIPVMVIIGAMVAVVLLVIYLLPYFAQWAA